MPALSPVTSTELKEHILSNTDYNQSLELLEILLDGRYSVWEDGTLLEVRHRVDSKGKLEFHIYSNEHPPPHFHVKTKDIDALFRIDDGSLEKGKINGSDQAKVKFWYDANRSTLIQKWNSTRPSDCPVGPIKE